MISRLIFCLALFISLSACARIQAPVVTEVSQRSVGSPSKPPSTATPNDVPPPTKTATKTKTPNPTHTPTHTPLPSSTLTVKPHELAITVDNLQSIALFMEFGRSSPTQVIWALNGNSLIVASLGKVSLMKADTFEIIRTFEIRQAVNPFTGVGNLAVSPNGKRLFTTNESVEAWDMTNGQYIEAWGSIAGGIRSFSLSTDGRILALAGPARPGGGDPDYTMEIFDVLQGKKIYSVQQYGIIGAVAVNQNGRWIASNSERGIEIFDGQTGALHHTLSDQSGQIAFDMNNFLVIGYAQSTEAVQLWDVESGQLHTTLEDSFGSPTISADARWLALTAFRGQAGIVQIWDTSNYQLMQTLENDERIDAVAFNADGKRLVALTAQGLLIWDVESGQITHSFTDFTPPFQSIAFSPDSKLLFGGVDPYRIPAGNIHVWDIASGALQSATNIYTHSPTTSALSFNGQIRAEEWIDESTYPTTGAIRLIAIDTNEIMHELNGHEVISGEGFTGMVKSMVFNWDGSILASAGYDDSVRLWNVNTGQLLMTLPPHVSVTDVNFSPDGRYLATSSWDGTIRVWGIPSP